ncbi:hypothetical protein AD998_12955 [bacterium 336/3]|nr:hypothetical protein AD998_12955 [bacterium 336/3]
MQLSHILEKRVWKKDFRDFLLSFSFFFIEKRNFSLSIKNSTLSQNYYIWAFKNKTTKSYDSWRTKRN